MTERLRLAKLPGADRVDRDKHIIYGASAAQAVEALGHEMVLDTKTLQQIADLGNRNLANNGRTRDGIKSRYGHPGLSADGLGKTLARAKSWRVEGDKVLCDLHLIESAFQSYPNGGDVSLGDYVMNMAEQDPDLFGLSVVIRAQRFWVMADGSEQEARYGQKPPDGATTKYPVARVQRLDAVDVVDEPAANRDGMFSEFSDLFWSTNQDAEDAYGEIDDLLQRYNFSPEKARDFADRYFAARGFSSNSEVEMEGEVTSAPVVPAVQPAPVADNSAAFAAMQAQIDEVTKRASRAELQVSLSRSGLSADGQEIILEAFDSGVPADRVNKLIERQRSVEAKLNEGRVVQGIVPAAGARVSSMLDGVDQITLALEALMNGTRPEKGVAPLQGIREAYIKLSGDHEMTGVFQPQNVTLAAVTTATMPYIMANVLNKRVIQMFNIYPRWYEKIVQSEDFPNLQDRRWHKIGGIGEMPTVAEGATYTETEWAEDYETAGWTKKGHYIGLTLEAMDKDDTGKLRMAPQALAQSAYLTLCKDVARLFTTNSHAGPVMRDTKAWFHADHGNLGTSAFSLSSLKATRLAMRKQTEIGSGERLVGGLNKPKYYLIPADLEDTALEILSSRLDPAEGSVTAHNKNNIFAEGEDASARMAAAREKLIVVDYWTDTNNWAAIADPNLFPSIGLGYRFGRTPEVFSVSDPNSGLMFTNDVMPIKVRWFYSLGIIDHRGVYKHNVA